MKRILVAGLLTLTLSTMIFAQGQMRGRAAGGPPPTGNGGKPDPTATLKAALGMTDAQVTAYQALIATEKTRVQAIQTEIASKVQALNALLNATGSNPTDVGNAAIAAHASEQKMAAEHTWFLGQFKSLLTGAQQTTLDSLIAAHTPIPGLSGFGGPGGPGPRGMMMRGRPQG